MLPSSSTTCGSWATYGGGRGRIFGARTASTPIPLFLPPPFSAPPQSPCAASSSSSSPSSSVAWHTHATLPPPSGDGGGFFKVFPSSSSSSTFSSDFLISLPPPPHHLAGCRGWLAVGPSKGRDFLSIAECTLCIVVEGISFRCRPLKLLLAKRPP